MGKTIVAVTGGVVLGLAIAFANAGAFQFPWGSGDESAKPQASSQNQPETNHRPAPPNAPEPNEPIVALPSWAPLVKRVMPTVVNVAVVQEVKSSGFPFSGDSGNGDDEGQGPGMGPQGPGGSPFGPSNPFGGGGDPFEQFRHFFGQMPRNYKEHGLGSGVIVSPDGYILTNDHVVGHADEIHITLLDKREFTAKVIGKDQKTDLALIKIDTSQQLPYATLGDSTKAEVGDPVMAIGSPFGFNLSVTSGIISAKGRALGGNYDDFIQTDASINPGNSGGPLFNTSGHVIAINTAIYSSTGANNGIGFAIPINLAKSVMEQLKVHGKVVRGWLGVEIQEVTPDLAKSFGLSMPSGALVAGVESDGPAAKAGIERGDIITKFNGETVHDEHELPEMVAATPIGKQVPIEVIRNGKHVTLNASIAVLKEQQLASAENPGEVGASWGLQVRDLTPELAQQLGLHSNKGVVVTGVKQDSPASDANLQQGDQILEINHKKIASADEFATLARQAQKDKSQALLLVQRGNATLYTVINPQG
ncbi:MAG: DegQ family serine endoprotease [Deltaproteobacteria bacterium]|nr:DegQ family serine endoprotease [Deltaproteobacteria bacterium]MBV8452136.1 DegQ family serine endoprotease [Deltaproteobacteria bacterium]